MQWVGSMRAAICTCDVYVCMCVNVYMPAGAFRSMTHVSLSCVIFLPDKICVLLLNNIVT
jgi:hypothetical protein